MRQVESAYRFPAGRRTARLSGGSPRRQQLLFFMRAAIVGGLVSLALVAYAALRRDYM